MRRFKQVFTVIRALGHVGVGLWMVGVMWPLFGEAKKIRWERAWSAKLLKIFKIRLQTEFLAPEADYATHGPCLLYSNHVSWLDIFAMNAHHPVTFIAKAEISSWPLAGILAVRTGTLFIERGKRHAVRDVIHAAVKVLQQGRSVAVFPEGTTGTGAQPQHFHSNFAQPAIATGVKLIPVSLQYLTPQGQFTAEPSFLGEQTMLENVKVLLNAPQGFVVKLTFHPPIEPDQKTRHELNREAFDLIEAHCKQSALN